MPVVIFRTHIMQFLPKESSGGGRLADVLKVETA